MVRYLTLITFTQQGLQNVHNSTERAKMFRADVERCGGKLLSQYWSMGDVDGCITFEAPSDSVAAELLLRLGKQGNVRTKSTRLFDEQEFTALAAKS
jgi:uncharacterized protein with GYD domain